jgi:hypothetical protein
LSINHSDTGGCEKGIKENSRRDKLVDKHLPVNLRGAEKIDGQQGFNLDLLQIRVIIDDIFIGTQHFRSVQGVIRGS